MVLFVSWAFEAANGRIAVWPIDDSGSRPMRQVYALQKARMVKQAAAQLAVCGTESADLFPWYCFRKSFQPELDCFLPCGAGRTVVDARLVGTFCAQAQILASLSNLSSTLRMSSSNNLLGV